MAAQGLILVCCGILLTLVPVGSGQGCVFYVVPSTQTRSQECPDSGEPCHTLEQYANDTSLLHCAKPDRNISLLFVDGNHSLCNSLTISSDNLSVSLRRAVDSQSGSGVTIELCGKEAEIVLSVDNVSVEQLNIHSNGSVGLSITDLQSVSVSNVTFRSATLFVKGSILSRVTVEHCKFIVETNVAIPPIKIILIQDIDIFDVHVTSENDLPLTQPYSPEQYSDIVVYTPYPDASINLSIIDSLFVRPSETGIFVCTLIPGYDVPATGYNIHVVISGTTVSDHRNGGIVFDMTFREPQYVNIQVYLYKTRIFANSATNCNGKVNGAGVTVYSQVDPNFSFNSSEITFDKSNVTHNANFCNHYDDGAIISTNRLVQNITVIDSTFEVNVGTPISVSNANLFFRGNFVTFSKNQANQGGALVLDSAHLYLVGCVHVTFDMNLVDDVGGAIFIVSPHVQFDTSFTDRRCFYEYVAVESHAEFPCFQLSFTNNIAKHGGDHIYGALMASNCIVFAPQGTNHPSGRVLIVRGYQLANNIQLCNDNKPCFIFEPNMTTSVSPISSDPLRVCLCDDPENNTLPIDIRCTSTSDIFLTKSVFPGELFQINATVVGADFGTTTGSIYAQFLKQYLPHFPVLGSFYQYTQRVFDYKECTLLTYMVNSSNENEVLILTATDNAVHVYGDRRDVENDNQDKDAFKLQHTTPVYVNVSLRACPLGFFLSDVSMGCECHSVLEEHHITCNISNGTGYVYRTGTMYWINGTVDKDNETNIIVHKYCPYSYCKTQDLAVDLRYPDTQCASHHAGVLCGGCQQNYSFSLGSNRCLLCPDNSHLGLLILFIALGILLVFFIQFLDLTVKRGTINGLILYANIVWAYRTIFLREESTVTGLQAFLQTFIAWLNLDFGIETCFFVGLDAYWKTWLQFVFPLYIWCIAGCMIKLSAYSERIAKIFGENSVHVLATLLLLSYNKLLRACITALDFTFLTNSTTNTKQAVWSFDGNLVYCGFPHVVLFVAAIAVLLLLWLPYTLVLSLVQWLRNEKISRYRILKWIDNIKLKPFFDAYLSPLKDKHRYWIGLLLVVRGILMVTFALTSANSPTANLLTVGLLVALLLLHQGYNGRVYKSRWLSLLENSFICNLAVLSVVMLYLDDGNYHYYSIMYYCSIGVALCQFVCVVIFHICTRIVTLFCSKNPQGNYVNLDDSLLADDGRDR